MTLDRQPVLYLGHGAPPLADDPLWPSELAAWSAQIDRPRAILVVSAHWEAEPTTIGATTTVPLTYDFWGFPQKYFEVQYAAPGAPELAAEVQQVLGDIRQAPDRGLDHGAYVPLVEMYPDADIPVLQVSMPSLDPRELFEIGRRLAPLRDRGVLIIGSGFVTHNLSRINMHEDPALARPAWSVEFDQWTQEAMDRGDVDAFLDFMTKAPAAAVAHPRTEHFAPVFVSLGAAYGADGAPIQASTPVSGFWYGLSKRSFQLT